MKRRVVQHGPSTLTVSLPAQWVKERGIEKGDDLEIEHHRRGLLISAKRAKKNDVKHINAFGTHPITGKAFAALYKYGYNEIIIHYTHPDELHYLHTIINNGYIGFEIINETKTSVHIKKISEPQQEEFRLLFRRMAFFLLSVADDTHHAAQDHDIDSYRKLVLRDENINKLADVCRRIVNTGSQTEYKSDTALYHIIEQLEKIGDHYKDLNRTLIDCQAPLPAPVLGLLLEANKILHFYEQLFFAFTMEKMRQLIDDCKAFSTKADALLRSSTKYNAEAIGIMKQTVRDIDDLSGTTMMLHL
ncbi:TPA: phosphate uptake regulator PhoU [Candidatus Woesearchaeota archaeon]|nr:phosphate uptake regulator PhoU [Candidatus Woesearchaeota archaeon]